MITTLDSYQQILKSTSIYLHENVSMSGKGHLTSGCSIYPLNSISDLTLGGYSYISPHSEVTNISIGNYCSIARGFILGLSHPTDLLTTNPVAWRPWLAEKVFPGNIHHIYKPSYIGNDVWIGANVVMKEGVSIGDCCIIGAGSIVTKDIPPFSIAVGNPCRVIRNRFDDCLISKIKDSSWFNYDWSGFKLDWRNKFNTIDQMLNIINNDSAINFTTFKYEITNAGLIFTKV